MKHIWKCLFLVLSILLLLASCTGKTPDVVASEEKAELTLENLEWSIPVEGGDIAEYTLDDAQKHELGKGICALSISTASDAVAGTYAKFTSVIIEGLRVKDFLADQGREDASSMTFYGTDYLGKEIVYTMTPEMMQNDKVLIGWIMNKKELLPDTVTYVGIFDGSGDYADFKNSCSVTKIVIE